MYGPSAVALNSSCFRQWILLSRKLIPTAFKPCTEGTASNTYTHEEAPGTSVAPRELRTQTQRENKRYATPCLDRNVLTLLVSNAGGNSVVVIITRDELRSESNDHLRMHSTIHSRSGLHANSRQASAHDLPAQIESLIKQKDVYPI